MSYYTNIDQLTSRYNNYLDTILPVLTDIYKCPCQTCISSNTERINSLISNIKEFYSFIIKCKKFIKENKTYLKKIKELIPNMIKFNNVILQDISIINTQIGISIIYLEEDVEENNTEELNISNTSNYIFTLDKLFQYYPELRVEFMC
jgi:hypothetical protein